MQQVKSLDSLGKSLIHLAFLEIANHIMWCLDPEQSWIFDLESYDSTERIWYDNLKLEEYD